MLWEPQSPVGRGKSSLLSWHGLSKWKAIASVYCRFPASFLSLNTFFSLPTGYMHIANGGCRPWIAILCWSWIKSAFLEKYLATYVQFSSVILSCPILCDPMDCSMPGFPCPSPNSGPYSNSCPSRWWCHPTISSSIFPFSSCLQTF